ncbi:hypothetical protein [Streptomyces sp. NPDC002324]
MTTINLKPEHLPGDIATLLTGFLTAQRAAVEAQQTFDRTPIQLRGEPKEHLDQAKTAAAESLGALEAATARSNQQILDSAAGAFFAHVEAARTALATAETEMRNAAAAAALYATAQGRAGRRVMNIESESAGRSKGRQRAMLVVSEIRDVVSMLPEDVE